MNAVMLLSVHALMCILLKTDESRIENTSLCSYVVFSFGMLHTHTSFTLPMMFLQGCWILYFLNHKYVFSFPIIPGKQFVGIQPQGIQRHSHFIHVSITADDLVLVSRHGISSHDVSVCPEWYRPCMLRINILTCWIVLRKKSCLWD